MSKTPDFVGIWISIATLLSLQAAVEAKSLKPLLNLINNHSHQSLGFLSLPPLPPKEMVLKSVSQSAEAVLSSRCLPCSHLFPVISSNVFLFTWMGQDGKNSSNILFPISILNLGVHTFRSTKTLYQEIPLRMSSLGFNWKVNIFNLLKI